MTEAENQEAERRTAKALAGDSAYGDRMMRWFEHAHLPPQLGQVSAEFARLAGWIVENLPPGPERTVALRKLLEAKDAAVRSRMEGER